MNAIFTCFSKNITRLGNLLPVFLVRTFRLLKLTLKRANIVVDILDEDM